MKKILILFTIILSATLLVACGNGKKPVDASKEDKDLTSSILSSSYFDGLDLQGKTVNFFLSGADGENPFSDKFKSDNFTSPAYQYFIQEMTKKFNFKLEFKDYPNGAGDDIDKIVAAMQTEVNTNPDTASIVRLNETAKLVKFINAGLIPTLDKEIGTAPSDFFQDEWQRTKGTVLGHNFGIQRWDAKNYPDLMVFNRDLLKKAGIEDDMMPDVLWSKGQWTVDNLAKIVQKASASPEFAGKADKTVLGLTVYFMTNQVLNANGIHLIGNDGSLNIENNSAILDKYIDLVKNQNQAGRYLPVGYTKATQYYNFANRFADPFFKGDVAITMIQNWQRGSDSSKIEAFQAVPIPTIVQDNKKYLQGIEAGDVLSVTRGSNYKDVVKVLLALNKFNYVNYNKRLQNVTAPEFNLPKTTPIKQIFEYDTFRFFKGFPDNEKDMIQKQVDFLYGNLDDHGTKVAKVIPTELSALGVSLTYSTAVLHALMDGTSYQTAITQIAPQIKSEVQTLKTSVDNAFQWEESHQ